MVSRSSEGVLGALLILLPFVAGRRAGADESGAERSLGVAHHEQPPRCGCAENDMAFLADGVSGSGISMASGSAKAADASSTVTRCLRRLSSALFASRSNS